MGSHLSKPGPREKRFAAYMQGLANAAGHADRHTPLKNYCTGLLLPGERKSVEPMAARLAPNDVRRMHQSLHHLVATAPWNDEEMLEQVRQRVLPAMQKQGPVVAWTIDDTGFPKQGKHSVGVARQYCGQIGKQDNCQAAVSLSVSTWIRVCRLPGAYTCRKCGVRMPSAASERVFLKVARGVILADAGYGKGTQFRTDLTELGLQYIVGIESSATVWKPGHQPLPAPPRKPGRGATPTRLRRAEDHQPVSVRQLALDLPSSAWKDIGWRQGNRGTLRSRFAAVRVRPAHRDEKRTEPRPEEWLLIEWPKGASEPAKYWLSNLPAGTALKPLVKLAKHRWIIERDYEELKQELGLGHYEGRGWRGFHHHATLCIAAYGFLVSERSRFSPSVRVGHAGLRAAKPPKGFRPLGSPYTPRAA